MVRFIPKNQRIENRNIISEIATAIFGTPQAVEFAERFVPQGGRVPPPKVDTFVQFLINCPTCLWAVYSEKIVVGFVLIGNNPHNNSIGFGINPQHVRRGIMTSAWEDIKCHPCIQYPLYGYTSERNISAQGFMKSIGFFRTEENIDFCGEQSCKFVMTKSPCSEQSSKKLNKSNDKLRNRNLKKNKYVKGKNEYS